MDFDDFGMPTWIREIRPDKQVTANKDGAEITEMPGALVPRTSSSPPERTVHLLCLHEHMFDQDIQVNGVIYHVTKDGWLPHVPDSAADVLLQNPDCWNLCFDAESEMPRKASGEMAYITMPEEVVYNPMDRQLRIEGQVCLSGRSPDAPALPRYDKSKPRTKRGRSKKGTIT
ncbi:MAG: hypothetical protein EOO38_15025 [Cytophagaceae bacterium]|nr:MAG: hypothetical protein EOO38_15025 [Cytophagaceae bacterium]